MADNEGRNAAFSGGSQSVREPQFRTRQQLGSSGYRPTSTLDQIFPRANGRADADNQRQIYGFNESPLGRSDSTFDKELFIRDRKNPASLQKTFG